MKRIIVLLVAAILTLMFLAASVSADQNGNDRWCNSDEYGCWVTEENGGKSYIMFWSEEARAFFMGGKSKPGTLVTRKPDTPGGRFGMEEAPVPYKRTWRDMLWDMLNDHRVLLESQGMNIKKLYKQEVSSFESQIRNGEMTEAQVIDTINYWDNAYKQSEK